MASRIVYGCPWIKFIRAHRTLYVNKNVCFDKMLNVCSACCLGDNRAFHSDRTCCSDQTNVQVHALSDRVNTDSDCDSKNNHPNNLPNSVKHIRNKLRELHNLPKAQRTLSNSIENASKAVEAVEIGEQKVAHSHNEEYSMNYIAMQKKFPFIEPKPGNEYEKVIETSYGVLRFDNKMQNIEEGGVHIAESPDHLSKSDALEEMNISESADANFNIFDEQYFSYEGIQNPSDTITHMSSSNEQNIVHLENDNVDMTHISRTSKQLNFIPEYFNNDVISRPREYSTIKGDAQEKNESTDFTNKNNIFDEQYFGDEVLKQASSTKLETSRKQTSDQIEYTEHLENEQFNSLTAKLSKDMQDSSNFIDEQYFGNMEPQQSETRSDLIVQNVEHVQKDELENEEVKQSNNIVIDRETKQQKKEKNRPRANLDQPGSAYDMAMKIRFEMKGRAVDQKHKTEIEQKTTVPRDAKWTGQTDSQGFRILKNQVIDIENMPRDAVVGILKNSIIYEDDSMLAIDKPYGLPSHGGPGVHHSVGQLLENLAEKLTPAGENDTLYLVHRLDKDTTGVMLIAKNLQAQHILHSMFVKRQVIKKYWLLTKGVPSPPEGVIDIPMAEGTVQNMHRMTLSPNYSSDNKLMMKTAPVRQKRMEAITNYKVLDSNNSAALVECQPETGLKHQIRCHMAFALNTPILGDHKYSHYSKIAPQRLYPEILHRLGIRQAKVRHLPMHLHAKQIILPEFKDGRNLFISASLPKHFVQNMKWLKIKPPK